MADHDVDDSLGSRSLLWLLTLLLLTLLFWASQAQLDVVSQAPAVVKPAGQVKRIQHLEGGIVHQIAVQAGDVVAAGDLLVALESIRSRSELDELQVSQRTLLIQIQRLDAELQQAPTLTFDTTLQQYEPELVAQAQALFLERRQRLNHEIRVQQELIRQQRHQSSQITARRQAAQQILDFLNEQIEISRKLLERNLSSRMQHIDLLKERQRVEGQLAEDGAMLEGIQAAVAEAEQRIALLTATFREQARSDRQEALRTLRLLHERQKRIDDSLTRTELRAPVAGIVKQRFVDTVGEVVAAGGTLLELVPLDSQLLIEARLPTGDGGYLHPGQSAQLRLASADGFRFQPLAAQVERISPDTLLTEEGIPYYQVTLASGSDAFDNGRTRLPLAPGMQLQCAILIDQRSVLEYLLAPLFGSLSYALRER